MHKARLSGSISNFYLCSAEKCTNLVDEHIYIAIWSGRAISLGTKVTTSDNFRAGLKGLSFSQPECSLFAVNKGTKPKTAGRSTFENIHFIKLNFRLQQCKSVKTYNQLRGPHF